MQDVVCAVCGRRTALAPGTTMACPSCGAPIALPAQAQTEDDDSATRPIIPPAPADVQTGVAPPAATGRANGDDVTADYPMTPTPERTQDMPTSVSASGARITDSTDSLTQPVQPIEQPASQPTAAPSAEQPAVWPGADADASADAPPAQVGEQPKPPRRRNPFALLSLVVLLVLLLAVGAAGVLLANGRLPLFAATPTPTAVATETPAPTPTAPSDLTVFTDADHVYSIGYPANWLLATQNAPGSQQRLVIFSNPLANANFNVGTLSTTDVPAPQITAQTMATLGQKTGIANRSGPTSVFIAGQTWTQESGDVTMLVKGQPVAMHALTLAVIHGNHTVYILELAPVDTFATLEPFYQQMLQSFQFLN